MRYINVREIIIIIIIINIQKKGQYCEGFQTELTSSHIIAHVVLLIKQRGLILLLPQYETDELWQVSAISSSEFDFLDPIQRISIIFHG